MGGPGRSVLESQTNCSGFRHRVLRPLGRDGLGVPWLHHRICPEPVFVGLASLSLGFCIFLSVLLLWICLHASWFYQIFVTLRKRIAYEDECVVTEWAVTGVCTYVTACGQV